MRSCVSYDKVPYARVLTMGGGKFDNLTNSPKSNDAIAFDNNFAARRCPIDIGYPYSIGATYRSAVLQKYPPNLGE